MARISRTGTTDSTGVASTTVTGSGGGRLKFISRNGSLWSNSYEIEDLIFYDNATESSHNDNWFIRLPNITTMTRESDGTVIEWTGTYGHVECGNGRYYNVPTVIEFDVMEQVNARIQYYSGSATNVEKSYSLTRTGHYKCINTLTSQKIYCDDDLLYEATSTFPQYYFAFLSNVNGSVERMIKFSNFKVYPFFTAPQHYTPIALSSSTSIIQTGESATLTAELTNVLGEKLASKSVNFIEKFKPTNLYTNDGTDTSTLTIPSGASATVEDGALKITTSTSGEKNIAYNYNLNNSDNFLFECEIAKLGTSQSIAMYVKNSTTATGCWFAYENSTGKFGGGCVGSNFSNIDTGTLAVGDKIKIKQLNGVITLYHNDAVIYSKTANLGSNFKIGHYTNSGRVQYIKNIKITDWAEDTLIGTGTSNSQGIATCNNSITGTGKGERQFIASSSSILSEIYEVTDCIVKDSGITSNKTYNKSLNDDDFYLEFTVHPTTTDSSVARLLIRQDSTQYLNIGDLYNNANCGVQWSYGGVTSSFYGKGIYANVDTKVTLKRTGTSLVLTVGDSTYNISNCPLTFNYLEMAIVSNNSINDLKIYPI